MSHPYTMTAGRPDPMGATYDGTGVNFAVFSQHATRMVLCLFDGANREVAEIDLPENTGHVWHGHIGGLCPGQRYGFRAHGPYRPEEGHRFNPNKLLMDPYARQLTGHPVWDDALMAYDIGAPEVDLTFDTRDSADFMPRSIVCAAQPPLPGTRPDTPMAETVIYEAHVKGLTAARRDVDHPGTFRGLASDPMLDHLTRLGVTAVELLPVQAFVDDRQLLERGLSNYWGYMTAGFFAPEPRYMAGTDIAEFRHMVTRLHAAGIEVILDVVYNHTAEGNQRGPTLSFRGLDNASYYRLAENRRYYIDDTGTGNTLRVEHPMVLRLVLDSLRYWVEVMGVDGFRFDLCSALGRTASGFDREGPFFQAIRQDPVLSRVKLIAEPWDIGPGGYRLGAYPAPWSEWNDKYRDQVRGFWRGDRDMTRKLATRVVGSALRFDHDRRPATSSLNFLTAHDGFTLADLVAYSTKNNAANGEDNRDGHDGNVSDNLGVEGATDDPAITAARAQRRRNMMATLLLSQGTPMILGGDEIGNGQGGNNNAYCQDNPTGWIDWDGADDDFLAFCTRMIAFRAAHPILRQTRFLHSRARLVDGAPDLFWRRADGSAVTDADWRDRGLRHITAELRMASGTPGNLASDYAIFLIFNAGGRLSVSLPAPVAGHRWVRHVDTARPDAGPKSMRDKVPVRAMSVVVLVEEPDAARTARGQT